MELTGLAPGPRVGEIRRRVSEWAQDNRVEDRARDRGGGGAVGRGGAETPAGKPANDA